MNTLSWLMVASLSASLYGQSSFKTTAGGDQIYNAYGLQTEYKWHKVSGWMGAGYNDGVKFGGYLRVPLKVASETNKVGYAIGIGDQRLPALLDTDEYDSHGFSVRGVGLIHQTASSTSQVFSGVLSQEYALPFMHTSYTSADAFKITPLAAMILERQVSKTIQMHSLNIFNGKTTSIESIGWTPSKSWSFSAAAGEGAGTGYVAGASEFHRAKGNVRVSYTLAGKDFQRQEQPYYSIELHGLNARVNLTPIDAIRFMFAHEKSRTSITGLPPVTGTIDTARLAAHVFGFQISPAVSIVTTDAAPGRTLMETVSGSRRILPLWRTFGAYIHMDSPSFKQQTIVAVNEFRVNSRLAIRQNYNRMDDKNNFSFGGQWVSNFISFSVDQQIFTSPIASAFGGKSVFQAWAFNIRVRTPRGTNANVNTVVTPDGKVQWGGYLSGMRYDSVGLEHAGTGPVFSKYIIHGTVLDEVGKGVWGVAVKIGQETVLSDEAGEFYLDVKNIKPMIVAVVRESSIQPSYWRLIPPPSVAQGQLEAAPQQPVQITVSTVRSFSTIND